MKKITLLFAFLITSIGFSQTYDLLESFNGTGYEDAFGGTSAAYEADPTDASTQVVKITSTDGSGEIWQGINVVLTNGYTLTSATQLTMQLDVYSTTAITIAPKAQGGVSGAPDSVTSVDHTGSGWETLTFTFDKSLDSKAPANGDYNDFALHINWDTAGNTFGTPDGRVFYIKNLRGLPVSSGNGGSSTQEVVEDFEGTPAIAGFEGITSATIQDDPETGGSRGKVFQLVTNTGGNPWQGAQVDLATGVVLDITTDKTLKIDVYSTVAISVMAKVENTIGTTGAAAANTQSHDGSGWQTLTYTFTTGSDGSATADGEYSRVAFFPNRNSADSGWNDPIIDATIYVDNITGVKKSITPPPADPLPATAAPSPTNGDANILSIYSDTGAFAGNSNTWTQDYDFGTNGGSVDLDATAETNNALKMDFSVAGYGAGTNSPVDISSYTHVHFDYYAPTLDAGTNGHEFKFILIGDGQGEKDYIFKESGADAVIAFDQWVSVDVELSHYEALGLTKDKFLQYKLGSTSDLNTKIVYFDNIYFYNSATASLDNNDVLGFSMYPNPANNVLNISAQGTIEKAEVFNVLGKKVRSFTINKTKESLNISDLSTGIYLVKYSVDGKVGTAKFVKQ